MSGDAIRDKQLDQSTYESSILFAKFHELVSRRGFSDQSLLENGSNDRQRARLGPPRKSLIDPRQFGAAEAKVAGAGVFRSVLG